MSNIIRWDPFRELTSMRDSLDRLFDESLVRPFAAGSWDGGITPAMDMYQTENDVIVKMAVPGIKPEDLHISIANGVLTVQGELKEESEEKTKTYHLRERRVGSFSRSVALPLQTNADKAAAEFENGTLTLTMPKAEEVKARNISIKVKGAK